MDSYQRHNHSDYEKGKNFAKKHAQRGNKEKVHQKKYLQHYENQRSLYEDRAGLVHFIISFDPPKNGNCQFSAISYFLSSIGIHRSNQTIREEIVNYLDNNPTATDGTLYVLLSWDILQRMTGRTMFV